MKAACTVLKLKLISLLASFREMVESSSDSSKSATRRSKEIALVMVFKRMESGCAVVVVV